MKTAISLLFFLATLALTMFLGAAIGHAGPEPTANNLLNHLNHLNH